MRPRTGSVAEGEFAWHSTQLPRWLMRTSSRTASFPWAGADLHAADQEGFTALKHAAVYGYPELLRFLIAAGADVNHRTPEGQTAIGMIECCTPIKNRRKRIIKLLEQAGGER